MFKKRERVLGVINVLCACSPPTNLLVLTFSVAKFVATPSLRGELRVGTKRRLQESDESQEARTCSVEGHKTSCSNPGAVRLKSSTWETWKSVATAYDRWRAIGDHGPLRLCGEIGHDARPLLSMSSSMPEGSQAKTYQGWTRQIRICSISTFLGLFRLRDAWAIPGLAKTMLALPNQQPPRCLDSPGTRQRNWTTTTTPEP